MNLYDPYVVPILIQVYLHCIKCKAAKPVTLSMSPDVKRPQSIVAYRCSNCLPKSWRRSRREEILSKRFPLAYGSFRAMTGRCTCEGHSSFEHYGGRGITICPRWTGPRGFANFLADMGDRTADLSIDRIDVNGNYGPTNCRWATDEQQARNKRNSKPITEEDMEELTALIEKQREEENY
jgi:hypothetical protein